MTNLRQAATLTLKALDKLSKLGNGSQDGNSLGNTIAQEAREHLFTALAQPEQEPVAWQYKTVEAGVFVSDQHPPDVEVWNDIEWSKPLYITPPAAQPEQVDCPRCGHVCSQRPWVGLTDDEFLEACQLAERGNYLVAFQRIQAKLKERNI